MPQITKVAIRSAATVAIAASLLVAWPATAFLGGETIYNVHIMSYAPSNFRSLAASGAPIELIGLPPGGATAEETIAAIRMPNYWPQTPPRPVEVPGEGARLVFAFGVSGGVNGTMVCSGSAPGVALSDRLEVAAAYCRGDRRISEARMSIDAPVGPPDPQFARSMRRLVATLGPRVDPNRSRERGRIFIR